MRSFSDRKSLPVSNADGGIRRRLNINLNILQPPTFNSISSYASELRRSKSVSNIKKWWEVGLDWVLSRKPTFASDLEMNEEECAAIGNHNKGSWRHVLYKLTSHVRGKLVGSRDVGLPQTCKGATSLTTDR